MCRYANSAFQLLNPTTQLFFWYSKCYPNCSSVNGIKWKIYFGLINSSLNILQWIPFNPTLPYENLWFYGLQTKNLTITKDLFQHYPQVKYWRFEVFYSSISSTSQSVMDFVINSPPRNGTCSINLQNGIKGYLLYGKLKNFNEQNNFFLFSF